MSASFKTVTSPPPDRSSDRADAGAVGALIRTALARAADRDDVAHRRALEALDLLARRIEGREGATGPEATAERLADIGEGQTRLERRIDELDRRLAAPTAEVTDILSRVEAKAQAAAEAGDRIGDRLARTLAEERAALRVAVTELGVEATARASGETAAAVEKSMRPLADDLRRLLERFESGFENGGRAELAKALAALEQERARLAEFRAAEAAPAARTAESVEAVRREIQEIRLVQEAADRRVGEALQLLRNSLELLARRASEGGASAEAPSGAEAPQEARDMLAAARAAAARAVEEMDRAEREAARARLLAATQQRPSAAARLTDPEIDALTRIEEGSETNGSAPDKVRARSVDEALDPTPAPAAAETGRVGDVAATERPNGQDLAEIIRSIRNGARRLSEDESEGKSAARRPLRKPLTWGLAAIALVAGGVQTVSWLTDREGDRPALSETRPTAAPPAVAAAPAAPGLPLEVPADMVMGFDPNDADMIFRVAIRHLDGTGVPRDGAIAERWLRMAADKGSAKAAYRLGTIHEKGLLGTRDAERAKEWYRKAADGGNVAAMHNHAVMLAGGERPDFAQAVVWFRKAAEFGLRDSQYNAAVLAARGLGGPVDLTSAYVWFSLAAANGDSAAAGRRDEAARRLDPAALAAAKAQLQAFRVRTPDPAANEPASGV